MAHGGARSNAGRKPGAATKRTRKIADKAAKDGGVLPLEVMLDNMRFYHSEAAKKLADLLLKVDQDNADAKIEGIKALFSLREKAGDAAKEAAPYLHPRMSPVDGKQKVPDTIPYPDRLKSYEIKDAIAASTNVVPMRK